MRGAGVRVAALLAASAAALWQAPPARAQTPEIVITPDDQARFSDFVRQFRDEAIKAGIAPETYDRAMGPVTLNPRVETLNLAQPEFARPVWEYLAGAVSDRRIARGRDLLAENAELFQRLEATYGVPGEVLTAIWGLESAYGVSQGSFNLFEALATLAFQGPRADYGRRQLLAALKIAEAEGRDPATMTGSWAGAFGSTQFAPTTFLQYATDGDGDGKRDLWNSPADALASTANYLNRAGWRPGESWGEEVRLPPAFPYEEADPDNRKTFTEWAALGITQANGEPLPQTADESAVFLPAGYRGPAFLVRANFGVILKYNFATSYALAIGLLADRIDGAPGTVGAWPEDEAPLSLDDRIALQESLIALGYDTGGSDGVLGRLTRSAVRAFQKMSGLPADGFATASLLTRLLNARARQQ
jgi:membrane-bound lytic murein transglycosylase B